MGYSVHHVCCLEDNYSYIIVDGTTKEAAAVDPVEASKVLKKATELKVKLTHVLTTHKHWDHAGGNTDMSKAVKGIEIVGGEKDNVQGATKNVKHGDSFQVGNLMVDCMHAPCHTKGHTLYWIRDSKQDAGVLFTGDTLFIAGCGKFFEGNGEDMYNALYGRIGKLPDATKIYCGHEYTLSNLKFAVTVEPENKEVIEKLKWAKEQNKKEAPTIPSTVGEEKRTNPFMRVHTKDVAKYTKKNESKPTEVMSELRARKDAFKANI